MEFSNHAKKRMQQRATNLADAERIVSHGTQVREGYLLRERDVNTEIARLTSQIRALERLRNRAVICDGEAVITVYPAGRRKQKQLLRSVDRDGPSVGAKTKRLRDGCTRKYFGDHDAVAIGQLDNVLATLPAPEGHP